MSDIYMPTWIPNHDSYDDPGLPSGLSAPVNTNGAVPACHGIFDINFAYTETYGEEDISNPINKLSPEKFNLIADIYNFNHIELASTVDLLHASVDSLSGANLSRPMFGGYSFANLGTDPIITGAHQLDDMNSPYLKFLPANPDTFFDCPTDGHSHGDPFEPDLATELRTANAHVRSLDIWAFDNTTQRNLFIQRPDRFAHNPATTGYPTVTVAAGTTPHLGYHLFGRFAERVYWVTFKLYFKEVGDASGDLSFDRWEWRAEYEIAKTTDGEREGLSTTIQKGAVFPIMLPVRVSRGKYRVTHMLREGDLPVMNFISETEDGRDKPYAQWGL